MTPHLQQFARQLKSWTQELIDHGRTPFRRVDCLVDIITESGTLTPPLIFWINRQSMMAGGILLLPEKNIEEELQQGKSCAEALGLSHFVTWETEQVRLWGIDDEEINEHQRFPLPGTDHPDFFRQLLKEVIEALKVPAVTGALPHNKLSTSYFNNLFNVALELAQPALTEAFRSQRAEEAQDVFIDIDQRALEANRLLLLQTLTALYLGLLPDTLLPEDLGQVVATAFQQAPEPLCSHMSHYWEGAPAQLPMDTAVCYHHLLLRLQQLRWTSSKKRMQQSLLTLIAQWFPYHQHQTAEETAVILYPQVPCCSRRLNTVLSDSPLILACTSLIRELSGLPQPTAYYGSLIILDPQAVFCGDLSAQLLNQTPLTRSEKALYGARLRLSWPHRNFKFNGDQARWKWELIHLLGITRQNHRIRAELPMELLEIPPEEPLWYLLSNTFHLSSIITGEQTLLVDLIRSTTVTDPTRITLVNGTVRDIFTTDNPQQLRQHLIDNILGSDTVESRTTSHSKDVNQVSKNLKQDIIDQLNIQGIPNFPDQYLYFLEQPDTTRYDITPPLGVVSKLLGQFELLDAAGQKIQGVGEELEQALLICSRAGKTTFDLPQDREKLELLLQLYRKDLDNLHQQLCDLSYRQIKKPQAARNLIRSIWKKLTLPDPEWFKN